MPAIPSAIRTWEPAAKWRRCHLPCRSAPLLRLHRSLRSRPQLLRPPRLPRQRRRRPRRRPLRPARRLHVAPRQRAPSLRRRPRTTEGRGFMLRPVLVFALVCSAGSLACGPKQPATTVPSPSPAPSAAPAPTPSPAAQVVNATILTNGCQALGASNARLAERAMYQLIEGCASVPGGKAQFEATLQPGGRVAISAVPGQPDVIPICVLKHALQHGVPLTQPCRLDVKLEQTSVSLGVDGGA